MTALLRTFPSIALYGAVVLLGYHGATLTVETAQGLLEVAVGSEATEGVV